MSQEQPINMDKYSDLTTEIVAAYVGNNSIEVSELPNLIREVHKALVGLDEEEAEVVEVERKPAVSIRKSITPDYLICLEDGQQFKSLKRHLRTHYGLSPEEYRERWGLPNDYPMVAPNYAQARSNLAKKMGLGQNRKG